MTSSQDSNKLFAVKLAIWNIPDIQASLAGTKHQFNFRGVPVGRLWIQAYVSRLRGDNLWLAPNSVGGSATSPNKQQELKVSIKFVQQDISAMGIGVGDYVSVIGQLKPTAAAAAKLSVAQTESQQWVSAQSAVFIKAHKVLKLEDAAEREELWIKELSLLHDKVYTCGSRS